MYTYKLGGMLITDELYHDDLEAMTFGRKDQNELMHYGIKGQSWGKRRFQNEDGSLTMAGRNRYDVGDPLQGSTNRAVAANRTYATGGGTGRFGGASGGGGSVMRKSAPTIQWSTPGKAPFSSEGPGQSAGRTVTNKVKAKVNDTVNSGRKAADSLFGSIGNAIKPVTDAVGKATEFVTGANANRRVADAQKAYDDASRHMLVDNMSNVIGTNGANAEHDAEDWQQLADIERARAKAYDISANNRGLFDFGGKEADRHNRDMYENEAREYANKANDLRVQAQKEYADDYRKLEEADRNLRAAEKARDENTLGGVVGNAAKDAGNWLGNAFNDAKNWVGDRAQDVGNVATNAYNDVSKAAGDAVNWVGDRARGVGNLVSNQDEKRAAENAQNVADRILDDAIARSGEYVPDEKGGEDLYIRDYNDAKVVDAADKRAADAKQAYENHPLTKIQNAAKDVGDWASNAASDVRDWGAGALDKGRQAFENLFGGAKSAANAVGEGATKVWNDVTGETKRQEQQKEQEYHDTLNSIGDTLRTAKTATERENALRDLISTMENNDAFRVRSGFQNDTPMSFWAERAKNNLDRIDRLQENLDKGYYTGEAAERAKREIAEAKIDNELTIGNFYNNTNASGRWGPDGLVGNYENTPDNVSQQEWDRYVAENYGHYPNRGRRTINHSALEDKPSGVTDSFWSDYITIGGTREKYDKALNDLVNRR